MKTLILFSSPNHDEYNLIWGKLIELEADYIRINGDGDKIYPFDGRTYCENYEWNADRLVGEIQRIVRDNNGSECMVMLHDYKIPSQLKEIFKDIEFVPYSGNVGLLYKDYVMPFINGDINKCFDNLWNELQGGQATENVPVERTRSHESLLTEGIIHDCNNAITNLSVAINKMIANSRHSRMSGREMIRAFGAGFIEEKYSRSMSAYEKIKGAFSDQTAIMLIPIRLAASRDQYAVIYSNAESTDSNADKDIVNNAQMIIQLLQETIDILEEVIQNG